MDSAHTTVPYHGTVAVITSDFYCLSEPNRERLSGELSKPFERKGVVLDVIV